MSDRTSGPRDWITTALLLVELVLLVTVLRRRRADRSDRSSGIGR